MQREMVVHARAGGGEVPLPPSFFLLMSLSCPETILVPDPIHTIQRIPSLIYYKAYGKARKAKGKER